MKKKNNFLTNIGFGLLVALTRPFAILPLGFHRAVGRFLGWLLRVVFRYRVDVVMINLSRAFPEKKYDELKQISRRFYRHMATLFCESFWFGGYGRNPKRLRKSGIVEITNPEFLNAYQDRGLCVYAMVSHMGNWELYGGMHDYAPEGELHMPENDLVVAYRRLSSPVWDKFMAWNRIAPCVDKKHFDGLVESFGIMKYAFVNRHTPKLYLFITDQYPYSDSSKVPVKFFGIDTVSMDGAPALAGLFKRPVCYMSMMMDEQTGKYRITFKHVADNASEMKVEDILARYYALVEEDIKAQPWNYLWTHKRWK